MRILESIIFLSFIFLASASLADPLQETQRHDSAGQEWNFRNDAYLKLAAGKYVDLERIYAVLVESYVGGKISEEEISFKFEIFSKASGLESKFDAWVSAYPKSYS